MKIFNPIYINVRSQVKEYELSEVFHHAEDEQHYEVLKMEHLTQNSISVMNGNSDIETAIEEERSEQEIHQRPRVHPRLQQFLPQSTTVPSSTIPPKNLTEDRFFNTM